MDSFKQLIEEDIRSKLSSKGVALAGYAKDMLKAKIGDARSQGRLDLRNLVADLKDSLEYFLGHQGLEPSISSILSFIENVLGTKVPETTVTSLVPNRANLSVNSPNKEDIKQIFNLIIDDTKSLSPADLKRLVREIENYRGDSRDEQLIIEWVKYIRLNHKDILELPEMEKLVPLGERIGDEYVEKVLVAIARNMLKNDAKAQAQNQSQQSKSDNSLTADENNNSDQTETTEITIPQKLTTKESVVSVLYSVGYKTGDMSNDRQKNEKGGTVLLDNFEERQKDFNDRFNISQLNKMAATVYTYLVQNPRISPENFRRGVMNHRDFSQDYLANTDLFNYLMDVLYKEIRGEGDGSGENVEKKLNAKIKDRNVASLVFCVVLSIFLYSYDQLP